MKTEAGTVSPCCKNSTRTPRIEKVWAAPACRKKFKMKWGGTASLQRTMFTYIALEVVKSGTGECYLLGSVGQFQRNIVQSKQNIPHLPFVREYLFNINSFWDVTLHSLVESWKCFKGT
jgi:hypothetical protein